MRNKLFSAIAYCVLTYPAVLRAQDTPLLVEEPEEIVVIGERQTLQLRLQMWDAEARAYEIFNRYNDDPRFDIQCTQHQPTGTRISRQVCTPRFQLDATRDHAQDYINGTSQFIPMHMVIARQLEEYRSTLKKVAEEQPDFLSAIIQYSEIRQRYEEATGKDE